VFGYTAVQDFTAYSYPPYEVISGQTVIVPLPDTIVDPQLFVNVQYIELPDIVVAEEPVI
jgi:hypothetical protein